MQPTQPITKRDLAIIVMGVSGSGKTTLAQLLAEKLQCPFVEGDTLHDARCVAKMSSGQPLTDDDRWPWLDRIGAALRAAVPQHGVVVAACSALRRVYRERLSVAIGTPTLFVLLDAPHNELSERLGNRGGHFMPQSLLPSQLATLEKPAHDEQALIIDAQRSPQQLCDEVLQFISRARKESDA